MLLTEKIWLSVEKYWNNLLQYSAFLMQKDHQANSNYLTKKKKKSLRTGWKKHIQISILWCWVGTTLCSSISYFQGNLAWKCCLKFYTIILKLGNIQRFHPLWSLQARPCISWYKVTLRLYLHEILYDNNTSMHTPPL